MLQLKHKGLKVTLSSTGMCHIKYFYPISGVYHHLFSEISATLGATIQSGRKPNTWFVVYETTGDSVSCFSAVNAVQNKLMIMSRTYKLHTLTAEIQSLSGH